MPPSRPLVLAAAVAATLVGTGLPAAAHETQQHTAHAQAAADVSPVLVAQMRRATAGFHDPQRAVEAGFLPTDVCRAGMGQHWISFENLFDGVHDPERPDFLLYEPVGDRLRLVAVEWWQYDDDQDTATDADRPSLGGVPFDGPMTGHSVEEPVHYDLHLHIWKHNPDGLTSSHNPRTSCASG